MNNICYSLLELELVVNNICKMITLIIDTAKDNVFFMIIDNDNIYNITHENSKNNYENNITHR